MSSSKYIASGYTTFPAVAVALLGTVGDLAVADCMQFAGVVLELVAQVVVVVLVVAAHYPMIAVAAAVVVVALAAA